MIRGYLEVNNDILNNYTDKQVVKYTHFSRIREDQYSEWDLQVSKRLGSGKEMLVDIRGNPIP
ncbi:uncharacterized protein N7525_009943 [Penicillium rubens]|uniref:uncharacterized protein n=1 Tax=Penicillium rubens TaxID=1108849 RepID=UPI002A5A4291|nr:uncharacterized protein N7525_009943 [Penicillium rubens]KAJ5820659.1 hypothetical protein N7525_009943 [Penicillium rubens]